MKTIAISGHIFLADWKKNAIELFHCVSYTEYKVKDLEGDWCKIYEWYDEELTAA